MAKLNIESTKDNINGVRRRFLRFLGDKNFKIYIISILSITLVISATIITVNITKSNKIKKAIDEKERIESLSSGPIQTVTVNSIAIPDNYKGKRDVSPIFYRSELENWSEEQISEFLYNSKQLAIEIIEKENDEEIKNIFKDIN